jgi:hypothetical protein
VEVVREWLLSKPRSPNSVRSSRPTARRPNGAGPCVVGSPKLDVESILQEARRLLSDLEHYVQRLHDLVYDSVSLELGGSE